MNYRVKLFAVTMLGTIACAAFAQDLAQPEVEESGAFKFAVSLGGTLNGGNSENSSVYGGIVGKAVKESLGEITLGVGGQYAESTNAETDETEKTVDNMKVFFDSKRNLGDAFYVSFDGDYLRDDIAEVDYRFTTALGLGAWIVNRETLKLSFGAAPGYMWEYVGGIGDDYPVIRFTENFEVAIGGGGAKFTQSATFTPKFDDFSDYILSAEAGLEAPISARFNLKVSLVDTYDATPAEDCKENDVGLIVAIVVNL